MLKQRVLMAEKYEKWEEGVRESKGESERLKFFLGRVRGSDLYHLARAKGAKSVKYPPRSAQMPPTAFLGHALFC